MVNGAFDVVAMLLLLRLGQILLLSGAVRSKNASAVAVRGLLDLAVSALALWAIGQAFDPWDTRLAGHPVFSHANVFGKGGDLGFRVWCVAIFVAGGAVLGATAERTRLLPVLIVTAALAGVVVPYMTEWAVFSVVATTIMSQGIALAAVAGGSAGLVLAKAVGPRKGKFNRDLSANLVPGHNVVLQVAGLLLIAVGLAPVGGISLVLGAATALLASAGYSRFRFGLPDVPLLLAGGLSGIIAATALAAAPDVGHSLLGGGGAAAVLVGAIAGVLTPIVIIWVETRLRIDDVAGLATASLVGGVLGPVVGILVQWPTTFSRYAVGAGRVAGVWIATILLAGLIAWLVGQAFGRRGKLRVSETAEYDGLDLTDLDLNAYPDFQQTMIKSHHLRQL